MVDKTQANKNNSTQDKKDTPKDTNASAQLQAEKDLKQDPDLIEDETNDLDEGELARLEGEE